MRRVDIECPKCGQRRDDVYLQSGVAYPVCECGAQFEWVPSAGAAVKGDDIPGGVDIRHGLCNSDGTARRYYSYSEMAREAKKRGLTNWVERGNSDKKDYDRLTRLPGRS